MGKWKSNVVFGMSVVTLGLYAVSAIMNAAEAAKRSKLTDYLLNTAKPNPVKEEPDKEGSEEF